MTRRANFMIVSGNGRNTGKTSFVCRIISSVSKSYALTAIKVSPHFHTANNEEVIIVKNKNFVLYEEIDRNSSKDSSRMLRAGAVKVFYIEAKDTHLKEAVKALFENFHIEGPVICESGGLRSLIEPSLLILLNKAGQSEMKPGFVKLLPRADKIVQFNGTDFSFNPEKIGYDGLRWHL